MSGVLQAVFQNQRSFVVSKNFVSLITPPTSTNSSWLGGLKFDSNGNLYVMGGAGAAITGSLVVYDTTGTVSLQKQAYYPAGGELGSAVYIDASGNYYTFSVYTSPNTYVVQKFSVGGGYWGYSYPATNGNSGSGPFDVAITVDSSGNVYTSFSARESINSYDRNVLHAYNSTGTKLYGKTFYTASATNNYGTFLATSNIMLDASGNMYQIGNTYSTSAGQTGFNVIKSTTIPNTTTDGVFSYISSGTAYMYGSVYDSVNNFVYGVGEASGGSSKGGMIVKYNTSLAAQWVKSFGNSEQVKFRSAAVDTSGNIYAVGESYQGLTSPTDFLVVVKVNSSGTLQWARSVTQNSGTTSYFESTRYLRLDVSGNSLAIATSLRILSPSAYRWVVLKFPTDGTGAGSYTVSSITFTYSTLSLTTYTPTMTTNTDARTPTDISFTHTARTDVTTTSSNTIGVTTI